VVVPAAYGDRIRIQVAALGQVEGPRSDVSERIWFLVPPPAAPAPDPTPNPPPAQPGGETPPNGSPPDPVEGVKTSPDFNGDDRADLLLRDGSSGTTVIWTMGANGRGGSLHLGALPLSWAIAGNGDYDGDGHSDLLTRDDATTAVSMQLLVSGALVGGGQLAPALSPDWELAASGDIDGDGRDDILLRNARSKRLEIWFMHGPEILKRAELKDPCSSNWQVAGLADFNGDQRADILCYSEKKQRVQVSILNAKLKGKSSKLFKIKQLGDVVAAGDADGNGLADVVFRMRDTGELSIWFTDLKKGKPFSAGSLVLDHAAFLPAGVRGDGLARFEVQGGGDFDGDQRLDLVLRDAARGDLRVWFLDRASVQSEVRLADPGRTWVFEGVGVESPATHR
jgi:hypothetical protein